MKILAILLTFLTLCLSAVPCCSENYADHQTCEESSDCDDAPCDEPCSPFYACGSCTGFSVQEVVVFTFIQEPLVNQKIVSNIPFHRDDYQSPSFKPPKVGLEAV